MSWIDTSAGGTRYWQEIELLSIDYPNMAVCIGGSNMVFAHGWLQSNNLSFGQYYLYAQFAHRHPYDRPRIFLPHEHFSASTPHVYPDNEICVEHDDWRPTDTMAVALGWAVQWIALWEEFRRTERTW